MELTWYGLSCFRFTERKYTTVVTDPYNGHLGLPALKLKADVVTISHDARGHNYVDGVSGTRHQLAAPGEYEIGGVFITGVSTDGAGGKKKSKDFAARNTVYVFDYDGITVAHLGDLQQVPTQSEIESLGTINVALVPVGGGGGLNAAKAAEVISLIEPNIVIPMHYATSATKISLDSLNKFVKEMGLSKPETQPSLKVTRSGLPDETRVVVLEYQKS